jgi:hypothetical protein
LEIRRKNLSPSIHYSEKCDYFSLFGGEKEILEFRNGFSV